MEELAEFVTACSSRTDVVHARRRQYSETLCGATNVEQAMSVQPFDPNYAWACKQCAKHVRRLQAVAKPKAQEL